MTGRERTVVVADDVAAIRALANAVLTGSGITVLEAESGEEAIAATKEHVPDVVLLDIAMPGMDGVEVLKRLRSDPETEKIPVVIVTALAHSALAEQAMTLGANDLIEKPFTPTELRTIVDKWSPDS